MSLEVGQQNAHASELFLGCQSEVNDLHIKFYFFFILRLCLFVDVDASQYDIFNKAQCLKENVTLLLLYIKLIYLHLSVAGMHSSLC